MQESNNNDAVTPYRASGNLNTSIGIPKIDVNDPMNINIQSVNTNSSSNNKIDNSFVNNNIQSMNVVQNPQPNVIPNYYSNDSTNRVQNNYNNVNNNVNTGNIDSNVNVKRTFVSDSNRAKKKKVTLDFGPEFKIALLIVVVLLVFIFLLPVISSFIDG